MQRKYKIHIVVKSFFSPHTLSLSALICVFTVKPVIGHIGTWNVGGVCLKQRERAKVCRISNYVVKSKRGNLNFHVKTNCCGNFHLLSVPLFCHIYLPACLWRTSCYHLLPLDVAPAPQCGCTGMQQQHTRSEAAEWRTLRQLRTVCWLRAALTEQDPSCRPAVHRYDRSSCAWRPHRLLERLRVVSPRRTDQLSCLRRLPIGASSPGHYHSVQPPLVSVCAGVFIRAVSPQETGQLCNTEVWWTFTWQGEGHYSVIPLEVYLTLTTQAAQ